MLLIVVRNRDHGTNIQTWFVFSGRGVSGPASIFYRVTVLLWIGLGLAWFAGLISTIQADMERAFNRTVETVDEELDGKSSHEEVR